MASNPLLPNRAPLNPVGYRAPRLGQGYAGGAGAVNPFDPGGTGSSGIPSVDPFNPGGGARVNMGGINPLDPGGPSPAQLALQQRYAQGENQQWQFARRHMQGGEQWYQLHQKNMIAGHLYQMGVMDQLKSDMQHAGMDIATDKWQNSEMKKFENMNLPQDYIDVLEDVVKLRNTYGLDLHHQSTFERIMQPLADIEYAGAGFLKGVVKKMRGPQDQPPGFAEEANPVNWYHAIGAGFHEVPSAVHGHYTYDQFLRENNDPGSIMYRFARPIGMGMSVLYDPTTYLTAGASSASKAVAMHLLDQSAREVAESAARMIAEHPGQLMNTVHGPVELTYDNMPLIRNQIALQENRPFTLGDALDHLRQQGLDIKQSVRDTGEYLNPKTGEMVKAGPVTKGMAYLAPYNVKGGRGLRFMGAQVPGTPALGAKLSVAARTAVNRSKLLSSTGEAFIPSWGARHVIADQDRASALVSWTRFRTAQQKLLADAAGSVRTTGGLVATEGDITSTVGRQVQKMKDVGLSGKAGEKLWTDLSDHYGIHQTQALHEFVFKTEARVLGKKFLDGLLQDTRFALPATAVEHAPSGYVLHTVGNTKYYINSAIIDGVKTLSDPVTVDKWLQGAIMKLNKVQNWWKLYATAPNPAFHVMNLLGAMWNNALAGVYNPMDYVDALSGIYQARRESAAQAGARFGITRQVPQSTPQGLAIQKLVGEAEARSGLGRSSFLFGDVTHGNYTPQELAQSDLPLSKLDPAYSRAINESIQAGRNFLRRQVLPEGGPGVGKRAAKLYGISVPRKAVGVALAAHANPMAFAAFAPELARAGRRVGGTIESFVRLAPFMKYSKDPTIARALAEYGPIGSSIKFSLPKGVEQRGVGELKTQALQPGRFTKADEQTMYDIGAHITAHFQFDYSDLTPFERYIAKSVFPFWVYYKKNLALQVTQMAKRPLAFNVANRIMNFVNDNGANYKLGPWAEILPTYFHNLEAFQVPVPNSVRGTLGLPKNMPLFLNPKMPFLSINMIPNMYDILRDPSQTSPQKALAAIAPIAGAWGTFSPFPLGIPGSKLLLEYGTGHNFGLDRPIDYQRVQSGDIRESHVTAPSWFPLIPDVIRKGLFHAYKDPKGQWKISASTNYVLQQVTSPFINNLGQSITIQGGDETDKEKARANLVTWLTGVRLIPVDTLRLDRNAMYDLKNRIDAKFADARIRGITLSDQDYETRAMINAELPIINLAYDEREQTGLFSPSAGG